MIEPFDLLLSHGETMPGSLAIAGEGVQITYAQLLDSAVKVAGGLRAAGVVPGSVVALAMPARLEAVFIQALFHEAAVSCTLPRRLHSPADVGIDLVFATPDHQVDVPGVPVITVDAAWLRALDTGPQQLAQRRYESPSALCRLVFSSGTTGSPKAVPFTVELSQFRTESARNYWMTPEPFMSLLGLPTVSGYQTYFGAITAGTTYVIPSLAATNLALMQEFEIASIKASPLQLEALVNAMAPIPTVLPHLRKIQSAGSFLPAALAARLEKVFACEVVNLYGSSELGTVSVKRGNCIDPHDVGYLVPDVQAQCVDESDLPLPQGREGRLRFRRELQASGYVGDSRASADHFRDGWFYPGDRGVIGADGSLTVQGRLSDIINAAGTKVDPLVVEAHAMTIAGIHDAACFKASSLNGVEQVGLAMVCDAALDIDSVAASLRLVLGNAAPLAFMRVAEIPRNDMGKVLRVQLAADFATLLAATREP